MIPALIRFWKLLDHTDQWHVGVALMLVVVGAILETIGVGVLPVMVAVLSSPDIMTKKLSAYTGWQFFERLDATHAVLWVTTTVGVFFLLKNIFIPWVVYRQGLLKSQLQGKLGRELLHGYLHAPYAWHLNHSSSDIQQTMQQEVNYLVVRILAPVFIFISESAVIVMVIGLLMWFAPLATLMTMVLILGTSVVYSQFFRAKLQKLGEVQKEKSAGLFKCVQHSLGGIKELKVLGRTDYFEGQYDKLVDVVTRADQFGVTVSTNVKSVLEGLAVVSLSLIVIVLVAIHHDMQTILPSLVLFAIAAVRLMPSANRLVVSQTMVRYGLPGFLRLMNDIEEVRHFRPVESEKPSASAIPWSFHREIEISNASYRYPLATRDSLTQINVKIAKGQSVAFVGESGAGKTTLVDIVLGLLKPTEGSILVDGKDIQQFLTTWQQHIGYIPQNIYLSDESLRSNVAFGIAQEQIDDDRVWMALEAAQLADLVRSWPDQINRLIGERGVRLSGGQRQRIGIARAFYHNPAILVLDEATAALDNETEREIVAVLEKFRGEKTLMTIAHRLTTVRHCDKLFYLNDGQVIASGSYDQLEKECPAFQRMILAAKSNGSALLEAPVAVAEPARKSKRVKKPSSAPRIENTP